jgi:hypothetical protein
MSDTLKKVGVGGVVFMLAADKVWPRVFHEATPSLAYVLAGAIGAALGNKLAWYTRALELTIHRALGWISPGRFSRLMGRHHSEQFQPPPPPQGPPPGVRSSMPPAPELPESQTVSIPASSSRTDRKKRSA